MPYSKRLYDMLPVFARMVDEERGLLRHICDWGVQPELDNLYSKIQLQEYFYNPDHPASWGHLDWLGQFVGLGIIDGHWLGVGLKPSWSIETKVDVIKRAWNYWQIKGSEPGIREAIAMWLRFEDRDRLLLNLPFGTTPIDEPPNWHGWGTPYDVSLNQTFPEKQRLGWGNYWGTHYQPDYFTLQAEWTWEWGVLEGSDETIEVGEIWQDRVEGEENRPLFDYVEPPDIYMDRSRMGDRELWMHFYLKETEWNHIFPDIFELNLEILPVTTTASVFGWLQGIRQPAIVPLIQAKTDEEQTVTEFEYDGFQWGQLVSVGDWKLPDDAWAYAGTLWPFEPTDPYTTTETIESKIEWGIWEPYWWDGQPWGTVIGTEAHHESLSISVELEPISTLTGETLSIDTSDLPYYSESAPTYWYTPWEERIITEMITVQHPGTECLEGIPIKFNDAPDTLTISLGRSLSQVTNQLFVPYETEGEPRIISNEEAYQQTLSAELSRSDAGGFLKATINKEPPGEWIDSSFLYLGSADISEEGFEPGYVERNFPLEGFVPARVEPPVPTQVVRSPTQPPVVFTSASAIPEVETTEGDWMEGYFFDMEEASEPEFQLGYAEYSVPVAGIDSAIIDGFEPGVAQGGASLPPAIQVPSPTPVPVVAPVVSPILLDDFVPASAVMENQADGITEVEFEPGHVQGNYPVLEEFEDGVVQDTILPSNNPDIVLGVPATEESNWIEAYFSDAEEAIEPRFDPGYIERSLPVSGFDSGSISGFQSGRTQGNYPVPEGFEDGAVEEDLPPVVVVPVPTPNTDEFESAAVRGFEPGRIQGNYPVPEGFEDAGFGFDQFEPVETLTGETLDSKTSDPPQGWIVPTTRIGMEIEEPTAIATFNGDYEEYSYYYDSGYTGEISEAADPIETLSINTSGLEPIETLFASPDIDGYLCNVFAGWSTLTPVNVRQRKPDVSDDYSVFDLYPLLAQAIDGEKWKLLVETDEEYYILRPVTMFCKERGRQIPVGKEVRRSQIFSFEEGFTDLYLEFVFQPKIDTYIQSASLSLGEKLIQHQNYYYKLNAPDEAYIGFVFDVPFRLPSGADSPQEELLLEEILPNLTQELLQLAGLPPSSGLIPAPVITTLPTEPVVQPETLKDLLRSLRDLMRDKVGDKHFPHAIATPSTEVYIEHNLGKHPSVTFVDTVDGEGNKSYGDVTYIDRNSIVIRFSEPTIGRVFCN
jgi:hypothetical protein